MVGRADPQGGRRTLRIAPIRFSGGGRRPCWRRDGARHRRGVGHRARAAVALARAGHDVEVTWLREEAAAEATAAEVREAGRRAVLGPIDIADPAGAAVAVERWRLQAAERNRSPW